MSREVEWRWGVWDCIGTIVDGYVDDLGVCPNPGQRTLEPDEYQEPGVWDLPENMISEMIQAGVDEHHDSLRAAREYQAECWADEQRGR